MGGRYRNDGADASLQAPRKKNKKQKKRKRGGNNLNLKPSPRKIEPRNGQIIEDGLSESDDEQLKDISADEDSFKIETNGFPAYNND